MEIPKVEVECDIINCENWIGEKNQKYGYCSNSSIRIILYGGQLSSMREGVESHPICTNMHLTYDPKYINLDEQRVKSSDIAPHQTIQDIKHIYNKLSEVTQNLIQNDKEKKYITSVLADQHSRFKESAEKILETLEHIQIEDQRNSLLWHKNLGSMYTLLQLKEHDCNFGHWEKQSDFLSGLQIVEEKLSHKKEILVPHCYHKCPICNYNIPTEKFFEIDKWKWSASLYHMVLFHNAKPNDDFINFIIDNYWCDGEILNKDYIELNIQKVSDTPGTKMKCYFHSNQVSDILNFANILERIEFRTAKCRTMQTEICPICGEKISSSLYNDHVWIWQAALRKHHIIKHGVIPQQEFIDYIMENYNQ